MKWRNIKTAPKDGTHIWVFAVSDNDPYDRPSTYAEAWWGDEGGTETPHWMGLGLTCWHLPTHWMPLPKAPNDAREGRLD